MSGVSFLYCESAVVPRDIGQLIGPNKVMGDVIFDRRPLRDHIESAVKKVDEVSFEYIRTQDDLDRLKSLLPPDRYCVALSSSNFFHDLEELSALVEKLALTKLNVDLRPINHQRALAGLSGPFSDVRSFIQTSIVNETSAIPGEATSRAGIVDELRHEALVHFDTYLDLVNLLQKRHNVRYFNSLSGDRYTLTKVSNNKQKIKAEWACYELFPQAMQGFLVRPFDFVEKEEVASYKMERLLIPDVAAQWINGSIELPEFKQLLDKIFYFFSTRENVDTPKSGVLAAYDQWFLTKVRSRITSFEALPEAEKISTYLNNHLGMAGGVRGLLDRFESLYQQRRGAMRASLCFSHGDSCFSNILYDRKIDLLRLIDPRGGLEAADLQMPAHYDLAKLSHSILGGYDFINSGLFQVEFDAMLSGQLKLQEPRDLSSHKQLFVEQLAQHDISLQELRLFEVSLFLSMLPLHAESPKKMLGFALRAAEIMTELETK